MKQILQSLKTGEIEVADVPNPVAGPNEILVGTTRTMVSAGTERMLLKFGKSGWIGKARQQPDKVRDVIRKVKNDGIKSTVEAVRSKLDQPLPLGYCNVGTVLATGAGVHGFAIGQRVVSNAKHAGVASVPANLAAAIPDEVSDDEATVTVIAAIALQGIRLVAPTLGECVVVSGLGLIGLAAVQLLRANGCKVLGIDFSKERLALARSLGAETFDLSAGDPLLAAERFSGGRGVDAVVVTASTSSSEPISQAAHMCRKRGRIVLVGVTGLELSRADFYEKELSFQVSCSYGPGRYDPAYEAGGQDYPVGYVRWTAQRNFEAVLALMASGRFDAEALISHRFSVDDAVAAYDLVGGAAEALGVVLAFEDKHRVNEAPRSAIPLSSAPGSSRRTTFIGTGSYSTSVLIPAFKAAGAELVTAVSAGGVSALHASRKFGFAGAATDSFEAMASSESDIVVIATRHDLHARQVEFALSKAKHVFVEKPLALTLDEVAHVETAWRDAGGPAGPQLLVGFNRRFSTLTDDLKAALERRAAPMAITMTVNAGALPAQHWTLDPQVGGGRIIGEGVHFIDLARHLAGSPVQDWSVAGLSADTALIQLRFANGSIASIAYLANGSKSVPKERIEVFSGGAIYQIDNWRRLTVHGDKSCKSVKLWRQDKGQDAMARRFLAAVRGEAGAAVPVEELFEVARVTIGLAEELQRAG